MALRGLPRPGVFRRGGAAAPHAAAARLLPYRRRRPVLVISRRRDRSLLGSELPPSHRALLHHGR
eukprot:6121488-Pleurochrysis_carterae.AAC.1